MELVKQAGRRNFKKVEDAIANPKLPKVVEKK